MIAQPLTRNKNWREPRRKQGEHTATLLWVYQRHHGLQPGEGVWPGIAEGCGAVLRQVFLPEEAEEAEDPGVFDGLREDPDVGRALHVVMAVNQDGIPFHQPLEIHVVGQRQRGLRAKRQVVKDRQTRLSSPGLSLPLLSAHGLS